MLSHKCSFYLICVLILTIMGSGLLLTHRAMVATTGWPVPDLLNLQSTTEQWELEVLGLHYNLNKEKVQLAWLKDETLLRLQQFTSWGKPIFQEGLENLRDVTGLVFSRLTGE